MCSIQIGIVWMTECVSTHEQNLIFKDKHTFILSAENDMFLILKTQTNKERLAVKEKTLKKVEKIRECNTLQAKHINNTFPQRE